MRQVSHSYNRRQVRRVDINYRLIALVTVILLAILFVIFGVSSKIKVEAAETPAVKCFTSITVEDGDTLTSIAHEYMDSHYSDASDYIEEVKQMNGLKEDDDTIHAGEHLTVPYYVEDDI